MKIKYGGTRIVFLFRNYVVKIPRIGVLRLFIRLFFHFKKGQVKEKLNEHKVDLSFIIRKFILCGFIANWNEYKYSQNHKSESENATVKVIGLIFGFIEIQERGKRIPTYDPRWTKLKMILCQNKIKDHDCLYEKNYSFIDGKICLHDYGEKQTLSEIDKVIKILNKFNKKSLVT